MGMFRLNSQDQTNLVAFLRDLVQTPSPSTQEGAVAERIVAEMTHLGFRDVHIDRIGNVVGRIGPGHGPVLMLNGHMDTVRVSDTPARCSARAEGGPRRGLRGAGGAVRGAGVTGVNRGRGGAPGLGGVG